MSDEFGFEESAFENAPEFGRAEDELGRRNTRPTRRPRPRPRPSPRPHASGRQLRPGSARPRPAAKPPRRGPGRLINRAPRVLVTDPYPMPPVGSERVRWAQDCLNRALGLSLPLTGLMAAETRSALRRFQGQQALRPSGILGPDTEQALRVACAQRPPNADDGTEQELGPLTATLKWIDEPPNSGNAKLFSVDEAAKQKGGGVYILMGKQRGGRRSILKVGRTHAFAKRFGKDSVYRPRTLPKPPRSRERVSDEFEDLRVYLARITRYLFKDIQIEKAISRLLRRANLKLPADQLKFVPTPVLGNVRIKNILPRQLLDRVRMHAQTAPAVGSDATLTLTKTAYPQWETLPASELSSWSEVSRPHAPGCHCPKCRVAAAGIHNLSGFGETMGMPAPTGRWLRRGNAIAVLGL